MRAPGPSEQAFPVTYDDGSVNPGMTMCQWFSGMALQGLVANGFAYRDRGPDQDGWDGVDHLTQLAHEIGKSMAEWFGEADQ